MRVIDWRVAGAGLECFRASEHNPGDPLKYPVSHSILAATGADSLGSITDPSCTPSAPDVSRLSQSVTTIGDLSEKDLLVQCERRQQLWYA